MVSTCASQTSGATTISSAVAIDSLRVRYRSGVDALKGIHLQISCGLFGLLGPNGAGKTTLMRTLATLQRPTSGTAHVFGHDVASEPDEVRWLLGYLPQDFQSYRQLRVWEALDYYALLNGMDDRKRRANRIDELLATTGLTQFAARKVGHLSGGMLRRLGVAQALLNEPRLLILDEPTVGLDPAERIHFRNTLAELSRDRVVILSTHIVSDIGSACQRLAVLVTGDIQFDGTVQALVARAAGKVWRSVVSDGEYTALRKRFPVTSMVETPTGLEIKLLSDTPVDSRWTEAEPNLEDAYLWLLRGVSHGR